MNKKFAKLEKIDLRELWSGVASEFTPWLSQEENIGDLGNIVGIDLKVQQRDHNPGMVQGDILCKDLRTDKFVLIENQLEQTDHTHLGKLITYAAELKAETIIWIARAFTEEHLTVLDWLNKVTGKSINFIGIEVEAYKIGDSLPAPSFKIVVQPEEWAREVKKLDSTLKVTDIKLLQQEYWQGLKNFMEAANSFVKLPNPPSDSWYNIPFGKSKYFLSAAINPQDISLNIWLTIIGEKAKEEFDRLYEIAYKDSLLEVNQNLFWDRMQADIKCAVTLKNYVDFMDHKERPVQYAWFKENLEKFDKYFRPRIREI